MMMTIFYLNNLVYNLIIKSEAVESLSLSQLLGKYPLLIYVCPTLSFNEEFENNGNLRALNSKSQSITRCLHFTAFYNIFVYTYYNAFLHLQSLTHIFTTFHFLKSEVRSPHAYALIMSGLDAKTRGVASVKIRNKLPFVLKMTMLFIYLIASHSYKIMSVFSIAHARSIELNETMRFNRLRFNFIITFKGNAELSIFLYNEFFSIRDQAVKIITKDRGGYIISFENISPLKRSPSGSSRFLPTYFTSMYNIITMLRYLFYDDILDLEYTYKEVPLFD
jgi:hypothetical protein